VLAAQTYEIGLGTAKFTLVLAALAAGRRASDVSAPLEVGAATAMAVASRAALVRVVRQLRCVVLRLTRKESTKPENRLCLRHDNDQRQCPCSRRARP
jgi:hypothetical protein